MWIIIQKGNSGYFWLTANEPMCSVMELSPGFQAISFERDKLPFSNQRKFGTGEVIDKGTVWKKWRLYGCDRIGVKDIIMGCGNESDMNPTKYAKIAISNYYM